MSAPNSTEGIPFALVGRNAENAVTVMKLLKPEYDVIHFCESTTTAASELPSLLSPNTTPTPTAAHPIGSNATRPPSSHRRPHAILVGAGFPDHEYEDLRRAVSEAFGEAVGEKVQGALWVRERKEDIKGLEREENWVVVEGKGRFPKPEVIAEGMRGVLDRALG